MPIVARPHGHAESAITVATYQRVSTLDQLYGFGLEDQSKICAGWLELRPEATVFDNYSDEAVSGSLASRPEMDRLVADAHNQSFTRILVSKVDRIGRTARAAYQWAWNMADIGVYFISVTEGIDTSTDVGWTQFKQYVTSAEIEWRRIKERTMAGRELKIGYGGWPGGPAPYGYKITDDVSWVGERRKKFSVLVTDEREAMVLTVAVGLVVDQGLNLTEAAHELNCRGLFTRSGVAWTVGNLRNRLHAETIHDGYVVYRKTKRGKGKNTTLCSADGIPVHGDQVRIGVPLIFSEERAKQLKESLKEIGFQNGRQENRLYPLSGRIFGSCGETYSGVGRGGGAAGRTYRCKGTLGSESCGEPHFSADEIEGAVWGKLIALLDDDVHMGVLAERRANSLPGDKVKYAERLLDFETRIARQENLVEKIIPEYMKAGVSAAVMKASVKSLEEELADLREQRNLAERWLEESAEFDRRARHLVDIANRAEAQPHSIGLEERKEIFEMLDVRVVPGEMPSTLKPGVKCEVSEWHWRTRTLVPQDPSDAAWEAVLVVLRQHFPKRHFTSKYDIRQQLCGMLHRLRHGLSWVDMPLTWGSVNSMRERQLAWWKRGVWPEVMATLQADAEGTHAYRRPTLPEITVTGQLRAGSAWRGAR